MSKTQELYVKAKSLIPGGTQLLSKRPEMFAPDQWPAYFSKAIGCEVWDLDGRHFYDMTSNGIGSCLLGFCDPDVNSAVKNRIDNGNMCTQNPPEEVELAELLCSIHPWAENVRYTRAGGEACAVAVRIARATTGRNVIAVCGYHGWHDWYLSLNLDEDDALSGHLLPGLDPVGVPAELRNTAYAFKLNDKEGFKNIVDKSGSNLAAVIMEPCRYHDPEPGFLEFVREKAHQSGALLIFDEITIGWRLTYGGAHVKHGINPDIAVFAKALGNGYPIGSVIGTKESMDGANRSFISSTSWTESIGPAAALATLKKMEKVRAHEHVAVIGRMIMESWMKNALKHGIEIIMDNGYPCLAHFSFKHDKSDVLRTIYTQMMLDRGFLAGCYIYPTMAHTNDIVKRFDQAIDEVFAEISTSIKQDKIQELLKGPIAHTGFRRLN